VVDGILGVTGLTNFTYKAWRKAADDREIIEVVTDVDRVRELNNKPITARNAATMWTTSTKGKLRPSRGDSFLGLPTRVSHHVGVRSVKSASLYADLRTAQLRQRDFSSCQVVRRYGLHDRFRAYH
jgi:hypothetical protein